MCCMAWVTSHMNQKIILLLMRYLAPETITAFSSLSLSVSYAYLSMLGHSLPLPDQQMVYS